MFAHWPAHDLGRGGGHMSVVIFTAQQFREIADNPFKAE